MNQYRKEIIEREREAMTDKERVGRSLESFDKIIKTERLNMSECLEVIEQMTTNLFANAVEDVTGTDELDVLSYLAEEFLSKLTTAVTNEIEGED